VPDGLAAVVARRAIEETAVLAASRTYSSHTWSVRSMTALSHNRGRPLLRAVRDTETSPKELVMLVHGSNRRELPSPY
jgi:hypothetical protein